MALLVYNLTGTALVLPFGAVVVTVPPSLSPPNRGPAYDVTSEARGLTGPEYAALEVLRPGAFDIEWDTYPSYSTAPLVTTQLAGGGGTKSYATIADLTADPPSLGTFAVVQSNKGWYIGTAAAWVRVPYDDPTFQAVTNWYVDTTTGSDDADGLTVGTPLLTLAEVFARINHPARTPSIAVVAHIDGASRYIPLANQFGDPSVTGWSAAFNQSYAETGSSFSANEGWVQGGYASAAFNAGVVLSGNYAFATGTGQSDGNNTFSCNRGSASFQDAFAANLADALGERSAAFNASAAHDYNSFASGQADAYGTLSFAAGYGFANNTRATAFNNSSCDGPEGFSANRGSSASYSGASFNGSYVDVAADDGFGCNSGTVEGNNGFAANYGQAEGARSAAFGNARATNHASFACGQSLSGGITSFSANFASANVNDSFAANSTTTNGINSAAFNYAYTNAGAPNSFACGRGAADLPDEFVHSSTISGQHRQVTYYATTTDVTSANFIGASGGEFSTTSNKAHSFRITVVAKITADGTLATFERIVSAQNVGGTLTILDQHTVYDYAGNAATITVTTTGAILRVTLNGVAGKTVNAACTIVATEV